MPSASLFCLSAALWLGLCPVRGSSESDQEFPPSRPYVEQVRSDGRYLDLPLKEAVRLALINNLEIAIEDFNEDVTEQKIFADSRRLRSGAQLHHGVEFERVAVHQHSGRGPQHPHVNTAGASSSSRRFASRFEAAGPSS